MKLLGFLICFVFPFYGNAAVISSIKTDNYSNTGAQLIVEASQEISVSIFQLKSPNRVVIDFKNAVFSSSIRKNFAKNSAIIKKIRTGSPKKNTQRIVLEIPNSKILKNNFWKKPDSKFKNWRFVLNLSSSEKELEKMKNSINISTKDKTVSLKPFKTQKKKTFKQKIIVLDPGHGGKDPGAISISGSYEKHLTLAMAYEIRPLLEKRGYTVFLTREKDKSLTLRSRIKFAHKKKADLFISIHADSAKNKRVKGLSVYTISERASDAEASALAERENKADIILGLNLNSYQPEVGNILIELAKRDTMDKSAKYAQLLVKEMKKGVKLVPNAHRFAGFVVLKSPSIPSILLEMGYLSNKQEEKNLKQKAYRAKLAQSIARSVDTYFQNLND